MIEPTRVGFGMRFRAANCSGCSRVLVQRDWRKLKPLKTVCPFCQTNVSYVIIKWPGYDKRMQAGASLISV